MPMNSYKSNYFNEESLAGSEIEMEIDENMIEIDEFAEFKNFNKSSSVQKKVNSIRKRSYSKEDVKISQNVIINNSCKPAGHVISDKGKSEGKSNDDEENSAAPDGLRYLK